MKSIIIIIFLVSLAFITAGTQGLKAQEDSTGRHVIFNDTVYIGRYYYVLTSDNQTSICRILGVNDKGILVYTDGETQNISMNDIISIKTFAIGETNVYDIKFRKTETHFILGAGVSIPTGTNSSSSYNYRTGPNILAGIILKLNNNIGFRGDIDFMHFSNDDRVYSDPYYSSVETGGALNNISVRMNILIGEFTQGKTDFYFLAGIGMGISYRSERKYKSTNYYNGTTTIYEGSSDATSQIFILGSVGFNVNYPISPKLRIFLEPQLNTYSVNSPNFGSLRGGIIF